MISRKQGKRYVDMLTFILMASWTLVVFLALVESHMYSQYDYTG